VLQNNLGKTGAKAAMALINSVGSVRIAILSLLRNDGLSLPIDFSSHHSIGQSRAQCHFEISKVMGWQNGIVTSGGKRSDGTFMIASIKKVRIQAIIERPTK
jgi:hypothetical protein